MLRQDLCPHLWLAWLLEVFWGLGLTWHQWTLRMSISLLVCIISLKIAINVYGNESWDPIDDKIPGVSELLWLRIFCQWACSSGALSMMTSYWHDVSQVQICLKVFLWIWPGFRAFSDRVLVINPHKSPSWWLSAVAVHWRELIHSLRDKSRRRDGIEWESFDKILTCPFNRFNVWNSNKQKFCEIYIFYALSDCWEAPTGRHELNCSSRAVDGWDWSIYLSW